MRDSSYTIKNEKASIMLWINVLVALLIIGGGAYSRGLYFSQEFLVVNGIIGILSLVAFPIILGNRSFKVDFLDAAVLAMGLVYTVAIFGAASMGDAIREAMRIWTYVMYYYILSRSLVNKTIMNVYSKGLILIGVALALFGIMTVPGWVRYTNSWTDVLSSTLQYHNAFASFIVGIMILAVYFWLEERKWVQGILLGMGIFIMAFSVAGSQSRGGYLIFLAAVLAMLFVYPAGKRRNLLFPVLNFFIGLLLWSRFLAAVNAKSSGLALLWLLIGCGLALILTVVKNYSAILDVKYTTKTINLSFAVLGVILLGVGVIVLMRHGGDVLATIKQINLQTHSVEERFVFYANAWQMFLERPLIGYGGGGWAAAYKGFQSYLYYSNETHSIVTKILVEAGILGMAALFALVGAVVRVVYKSAKTLKVLAPEDSNRMYNMVVFLSFLAIGGHALIDFDLSEGALSLLLWSMVAILKAISLQMSVPAVSQLEESTWRKYLNQKVVQVKPYQPLAGSDNKVSFAVMVFLTVMAAVMLIAPFFIMNGVKNSQAAAQDLQKQNFPQAVQDSEAAIQSFPFDAYSWLQAAEANMYILMSNGDNNSKEAVLTDIKRAAELSAYDPNILATEAEMLGSLGQSQPAYAIGQTIIPLAPFYNKSYEEYGQIALQYAVTETQTGDKAKAQAAAKEVVSIPQKITAKMENLDPYYKNLWIVPDKLEITPTVRLQMDQAQLLLGNLGSGKDLEGLTEDKQIGAQARMWLAGLATKNGDKAAVDRWTQGLTTQLKGNVAPIANLIGALS
ncbi:MAG: O-antigen ligase family protein [Desulfosporosinus sp.]|nr:O-antigen ligase family protein [Desulfosporosinus sp.]